MTHRERDDPPTRGGGRASEAHDRTRGHPVPGPRASEGGRPAERPDNIPKRGWPKRGWKDISWHVYGGLGEDRILMNAAAVTFYALLALFPAIAALVSIYGLFADPSRIANQLDTLSDIMPGGGMTVIRDQLTRVAAQGSGALTIGLVIGVLVSLWSANGGVKAMFDALNVVYGETEKRGFLWLNAITLTFTLAMLCFAIIALVAIVAVPAMLNALPDFLGTVIQWARWPVMAALIAVVLTCIYRYGPSRDEPKWRWISWGSVLAAVGWLVFSAAFSFYSANFGTFNQTYGSLGAVIGFMLWVWLSTTVILLGGKLNAEIEYQTVRGVTDGEPESLGERGAHATNIVGRGNDDSGPRRVLTGEQP